MKTYTDLESLIASIEGVLKNHSLLFAPDDEQKLSDNPYYSMQKFSEFRGQFQIYKKFINQETINKLYNTLSRIEQNLSSISSKKYSNHEEHSTVTHDTNLLLMDLPDLSAKEFEYNFEASIDDLNPIIDGIASSLTWVYELDIKSILKNSTDENRIEGTKLLINMHNYLFSDSKPDINLILKFKGFFENLKNIDHLNSVNKEIENAEKKLLQVRKDVGKTSNNSLSNAFKTEALSLECTIFLYTTLIFSTFTFLIASLICFIINSKKEGKYIFPDDIHFYYFYISLIFIITGFLTFVIKERTRLVNHYQYCNISHLEIDALSNYTAEMDDKSKIEDLKIHLADRYFKGPNAINENSPDLHNASLISLRLSEISKAIQDVKSTIK